LGLELLQSSGDDFRGEFNPVGVGDVSVFTTFFELNFSAISKSGDEF
jgi:hypothetical protein